MRIEKSSLKAKQKKGGGKEDSMGVVEGGRGIRETRKGDWVSRGNKFILYSRTLCGKLIKKEVVWYKICNFLLYFSIISDNFYELYSAQAHN